MELNNIKCNCPTPLHFKGLRVQMPRRIILEHTSLWHQWLGSNGKNWVLLCWMSPQTWSLSHKQWQKQ